MLDKLNLAYYLILPVMLGKYSTLILLIKKLSLRKLNNVLE